MISILRTTSNNKDFVKLVSNLDQDLANRDGDEHAFYQQFNSVGLLKYIVVAYADNTPIGCGAIKKFDSDTVEVKRMYVLPAFRGKGTAARILRHLEEWAVELGYVYAVLETGKRQPEAIALYTKNKYVPIANYGQYSGIENSVCFRKTLIP
ncbi:hypothetical protein LCGC14_1602550 [marine sediment metagenome]|uniref:GNAT family N-acetyltransferase n=2 Tax=root TaxID=1 RepID=A0A831VVY1_9FLAO|nr:GNAT family N-acetyltransferase [Pricia sp.]HEA21829.1 GNAT family N-acetyltransferase [Pricia antarctica]